MNVSQLLAFKQFEAFINGCFQLPGPEQIINLMPKILVNKDIIDAIDTEGRNTLYEIPEGFTILGHKHTIGDWSPPHDHGTTWAIYGVLEGKTLMNEWDLQSSGKVRHRKAYWIHPGEAYFYPIRAIHSHKTTDNSKLIRIEGVNIWRYNVDGKTFDIEPNDNIHISF